MVWRQRQKHRFGMSEALLVMSVSTVRQSSGSFFQFQFCRDSPLKFVFASQRPRWWQQSEDHFTKLRSDVGPLQGQVRECVRWCPRGVRATDFEVIRATNAQNPMFHIGANDFLDLTS